MWADVTAELGRTSKETEREEVGRLRRKAVETEAAAFEGTRRTHWTAAERRTSAGWMVVEDKARTVGVAHCKGKPLGTGTPTMVAAAAVAMVRSSLAWAAAAGKPGTSPEHTAAEWGRSRRPKGETRCYRNRMPRSKIALPAAAVAEDTGKRKLPVEGAAGAGVLVRMTTVKEVAVRIPLNSCRSTAAPGCVSATRLAEARASSAETKTTCSWCRPPMPVCSVRWYER
jgi:hypothetical protein